LLIALLLIMADVLITVNVIKIWGTSSCSSYFLPGLAMA
jgi:hypothetical protein